MSPVQIREKLRKALTADKRPQTEIARKIGITPSSLRRFKADIRDLSLDALTKLAVELGLEITVIEKKGKRL